MKSIIIGSSLIIASLGGLVYWQIARTSPSVVLLSPNGGETIEEGKTYTIKWETKNIPEADKISIHIRRIPPPSLQPEGQEFDPVVFINLDNTGSYDWRVSDMYPEGNYVLEINSYASIPVQEVISDESDAAFRIEKQNGFE